MEMRVSSVQRDHSPWCLRRDERSMFDTQASKPTIGRAQYGHQQFVCNAMIGGPLVERCKRTMRRAGCALPSNRNQSRAAVCAT